MSTAKDGDGDTDAEASLWEARIGHAPLSPLRLEHPHAEVRIESDDAADGDAEGDSDLFQASPPKRDWLGSGLSQLSRTSKYAMSSRSTGLIARATAKPPRPGDDDDDGVDLQYAEEVARRTSTPSTDSSAAPAIPGDISTGSASIGSPIRKGVRRSSSSQSSLSGSPPSAPPMAPPPAPPSDASTSTDGDTTDGDSDGGGVPTTPMSPMPHFDTHSIFGTMGSTSSTSSDGRDATLRGVSTGVPTTPMSPTPHSIFGTMGSMSSVSSDDRDATLRGTPPRSPTSPQLSHLELLRQSPTQRRSTDTIKLISGALSKPPQGPQVTGQSYVRIGAPTVPPPTGHEFNPADSWGGVLGPGSDATLTGLPMALAPPGELANDVPIGSFIGVLHDTDEDIDSMEEEECFERVIIAQGPVGRARSFTSDGGNASIQSAEINHIDLAFCSSPKTTPAGTPTLTRKSIKELRVPGSQLHPAPIVESQDCLSGVKDPTATALLRQDVDFNPPGSVSSASSYSDLVLESVTIPCSSLSKGGGDMGVFDAVIVPQSRGDGDMAFGAVAPALRVAPAKSEYDDVVIAVDVPTLERGGGGDMAFDAVIPEDSRSVDVGMAFEIDVPASPRVGADGWRSTTARLDTYTDTEDRTRTYTKHTPNPPAVLVETGVEVARGQSLPEMKAVAPVLQSPSEGAPTDRPLKSAAHHNQATLAAYLAAMVARLDEKVSDGGNDTHNLKARRRISGETMVMRESMAAKLRTKVNSVLAALRDVFPLASSVDCNFDEVGEVLATTGKTIEAVFDMTMDLSEVVFQAQNAVTYARLLVRNFVRLVRLILKSRVYVNVDLENSGLPLMMAILDMGTGLAGMLVRIEDTGAIHDEVNDPLVWMKLLGQPGTTDIVIPDPAAPPPLRVLAASEPTMIVGGKQRSLRCSQFLGAAGEPSADAASAAAAAVVLEFPEDPGRPDLAVRLRVLDSSTVSATARSPVVEICATVVSDELESGAVLQQPLILFIPHDAMKASPSGAAGNLGMVWCSGPGASWRSHAQVSPVASHPQSPGLFISAALPRFGWYLVETVAASVSTSPPPSRTVNVPAASQLPSSASSVSSASSAPSKPSRGAVPRRERRERRPRLVSSAGSDGSNSKSSATGSSENLGPRVVPRPNYHVGGTAIVQGGLVGSASRAVVVEVADIRDHDETIQLRYGGDGQGDGDQQFEVAKRVTWAKFHAALGSRRRSKSTVDQDQDRESSPRMHRDRAESAASEITVRPNVRLTSTTI